MHGIGTAPFQHLCQDMEKPLDKCKMIQYAEDTLIKSSNLNLSFAKTNLGKTENHFDPISFDPISHDTTKKTRKIELRSKSLEHAPQLLDTEEKSPYKNLLPRYDRNQARSKSTTAKRYRTQMIR